MEPSTQRRRLQPLAGDPLFITGAPASLWRLSHGVVRLDIERPEGRQLYRLALPGDLVGIDFLCGRPHGFSATALTPCVLEPVDVGDEAARSRLLAEVVVQQQQRGLDIMQLRSGPIKERLRHLLQQMGHIPDQAEGAPGLGLQSVRDALPPLKVLAALVDAESETVCRALPHLLRGARKNCGRPPLSRSRVVTGVPAPSLDRSGTRSLRH